MQRLSRWFKNMNLGKRFIFSLNLTVICVILILIVVATINRINTQKTDAENMLFNELEHLTTILDLTSEKDLEEIKDAFYQKSFYNTGYASLIDREGNVVICQHNEGENIAGKEFFVDIELIRHGHSKYYDEDEDKWKWQYFTWYAPQQSYIVATIDEYEFITKPVLNTLKILLFATILSLIVFGTVGYFVTRTVSSPLKKLAGIVDRLGKGILAEKFDYNYKDEVGQITQSVNNLVDGLKNTALFAKEIGNKNFDFEFTPLSEDDMLGNALLEMRQSLQDAVEEEKVRKAEDEKRNWTTQGIAKFGDILRQNYSDITELSYNVIKNLVEYMDTNQGGLFILNDDKEDNKFLELKACYAYDRRKYMEKHIQIGEGLIGTCFIEKETIHLTEIPNNYIHITSGLGDENPSALLIVPMKINEEVYGVIELASFKKFEYHQIEFVEKIGESIASTISNAKINQKTAMLLEKSQQQAEEMRAQEEEMRQNMEELHATQESMAEKDRENQKAISELKAELEKKENELKELRRKQNQKPSETDNEKKLQEQTQAKPGDSAKPQQDEKPADSKKEKKDSPEDTMKDVNDEQKSESQQEWTEHLKKSSKKFKKGRKK